MYNILKLCNANKIGLLVLLSRKGSMFSGCKRHFNGLEMCTISMSDATHCKTELVTVLQLYFLSFLLLQYNTHTGKKWSCKTQKGVIFLTCLLSYVTIVTKMFIQNVHKIWSSCLYGFHLH